MLAVVAEAANVEFKDCLPDCLRNVVLVPYVLVADTCKSNVFVKQPDLDRVPFGAFSKGLLFIPDVKRCLFLSEGVLSWYSFQFTNQV